MSFYMSEEDEAYYRRQAEDAEKLAERAIAARDRATWHRIAHKWLSLIRPRPSANGRDASLVR